MLGVGTHQPLSAVRRWYAPQLERIYDGIETRAADIAQLEQIAGRYPTRERFLTELTLDPPSAAGDLAGDPLLDDEDLVPDGHRLAAEFGEGAGLDLELRYATLEVVARQPRHAGEERRQLVEQRIGVPRYRSAWGQ